MKPLWLTVLSKETSELEVLVSSQTKIQNLPRSLKLMTRLCEERRDQIIRHA